MRKQYLEEVLRLTQGQGELLKYRDLKGFEEILMKKQEIIDKLEEIRAQGDSPITEEEREILIQIQAVDTKNTKDYEEELQSLRDELKRIRLHKAREQYFNTPYNIAMEEGMFIDKREYQR